MSTNNWRTYYVPNLGDKAVNKIDKIPALMELVF